MFSVAGRTDALFFNEWREAAHEWQQGRQKRR
jgi:hypothetical protein